MTDTSGWRSAAVAAWEAQGRYATYHGLTTFTLDVAPSGDERREPLLVLHGFPTSSFDFHLVLPALARHRRVLLLDMIGYGLSAKPDRAYSMALQADVVEAFVADRGITRLALLTHDMGDTVGGELLARQIDGDWPVEVTERVVTNGSIYIEMAHLSAGQEILLSLPDERLGEAFPADGATMKASLAATFSPKTSVDDAELEAAVELVAHHDGHRLLPRTIRYIEERRRNQNRFTGAIETHPSPLGIVWGADDPIAVVAMATRLHEARPDAPCHILPDVGHYPMVEAPDVFAEAVGAVLG